MYIEKIQSPAELKQLDLEALKVVAEETLDILVVRLQEVNVFRGKVVSGIFGILFLLVLAFLIEFPNLLPYVFHALFESNLMTSLQGLCFLVEFFIHINSWTNKDGIVFPHPYHVLCVFLKIMKRFLECRKRTFETLYQQHLHDACQLGGYCLGIMSF